MRNALIIGGATYTSLPGLPACARSANAVAAALRTLGFAVTMREDSSTGAIDAGITEFTQRAGAGPGSAFIYVCGYGASFNNRTFVLPATANLGRPSDVLTQGILTRSLLNPLTRDPKMAAVVAFDLVSPPDIPRQPEADLLSGAALTDGVGVIALAGPMPPDGMTPLAAALSANLTGPEVRTETLLTNVQARLATAKAAIAKLRMPMRGDYLAGAPPPPVAAPPPIVTAPPPAVPPVTPAVTASVAAPVVQPSGPPPVPMPDDAVMTEPERRMVQSALARLGYYAIAVDGVFGPETRAAIRRYQYEIKAEMTGRLTADQATQLVSRR